MLTQYRPHSSANVERAEFAKKLVKLLREKNMNQSELARAMGLSRDAPSAWVRARSMPEPAKLKKLADILGTTTEYLTLPIENDPTQSHMPLLMHSPSPTGEKPREIVNMQIDVEHNTAKLLINAEIPMDQAMKIIQFYRQTVMKE